MAGALGRSADLVFKGSVMVVVVQLLGSATPAFSLLINSTSPSTCSTICESQDCSNPAVLRYGKYCGIGYSGCSGQAPCDGLDSCCATHDRCIGSNLGNYLNTTCNGHLKTCVTNFKDSNQPQFAGANCSASTVENLIIVLMDVATVGGHGNPSSPINLQWAIVSVFMMSVVLLI